VDRVLLRLLLHDELEAVAVVAVVVNRQMVLMIHFADLLGNLLDFLRRKNRKVVRKLLR
jgi:hypothetical protein